MDSRKFDFETELSKQNKMFSLNQVIKSEPQQEENNETNFYCKICKAMFQQESEFGNHNCSLNFKKVEL